MKNIDVTIPVMQKVAGFESHRIRVWLVRFGLALFSLAVIIFLASLMALVKIRERGTLDLLTLFTQDREIIAEFWQDTLATFIEELPQRSLVVVALSGAAFVTAIILTQKKRKIIHRIQSELAKYVKISHN